MINSNDTRSQSKMEFSVTKWVRLPHCPPGQLEKGQDPTDAGYDLRIANDSLIEPINTLRYEWEEVASFDSLDETVKRKLSGVNSYFNEEHLRLEDGIVFRRKYKFNYISTGIKIQPGTMSWNGIFSRSGASSKYNISLINGVGIIDFKYGEELKIAAYAVESSTLFVRGERIAQLVPMSQPKVRFEEVDEEQFTNTRSGLGSSGMVEVPQPFFGANAY